MHGSVSARRSLAFPHDIALTVPGASVIVGPPSIPAGQEMTPPSGMLCKEGPSRSRLEARRQPVAWPPAPLVARLEERRPDVLSPEQQCVLLRRGGRLDRAWTCDSGFIWYERR